MGTIQHFASVEHPQTKEQYEAPNKVILPDLKRRLDKTKNRWFKKLKSMLWAYRRIAHSSTGETIFQLVYGTEVVIPVEIREPSRRIEAPLN